MNPIPCGSIADINGQIAVFALAGLPFAMLAMLMQTLTVWPGQLIWMIAGGFLPMRPRNGIIAAGLVAVFGFFGSWAGYALESHGSYSPIDCANVNEYARTFLSGLLAFVVGQALRQGRSTLAARKALKTS
jgi:hypothetical protein